MVFIGDKVKTEYGVGVVVGKICGDLVIQFQYREDLPDFIKQNQHGKGYWLELSEDTPLEVVKK